jgi:hypothetical protein
MRLISSEAILRIGPDPMRFQLGFDSHNPIRIFEKPCTDIGQDFWLEAPNLIEYKRGIAKRRRHRPIFALIMSVCLTTDR